MYFFSFYSRATNIKSKKAFETGTDPSHLPAIREINRQTFTGLLYAYGSLLYPLDLPNESQSIELLWNYVVHLSFISEYVE